MLRTTDHSIPHEIPTNARRSKAFTRRQLRALEIVWRGDQIERINDRSFRVKSQSNNGIHSVEWKLGKWSCGCPDYLSRNKHCKHIFSILYLLKLPIVLVSNSAALERLCPGCGSKWVVRNGERANKSGPVQIFVCNDCGLQFREGLSAEIKGNNYALMLLSLDLFYKKVTVRDIKNHIWQIYSINKSASTIHNWIVRLNRLMIEAARGLRPQVSKRWLGDEMIVKVNGKKKYLWNILDFQTRYHIVSILANGRREKEATAVLQHAIREAGKSPEEFVTDGLASYSKAIKRLEDTGIRIGHISNVGIEKVTNNNRIERRHGTIRDWIKAKRGMKEMSQEYFEGGLAYYNHIRPHQAMPNQSPPSMVGRKKLVSFLADSEKRNRKLE